MAAAVQFGEMGMFGAMTVLIDKKYAVSEAPVIPRMGETVMIRGRVYLVMSVCYAVDDLYTAVTVGLKHMKNTR